MRDVKVLWGMLIIQIISLLLASVSPWFLLLAGVIIVICETLVFGYLRILKAKRTGKYIRVGNYYKVVLWLFFGEDV